MSQDDDLRFIESIRSTKSSEEGISLLHKHDEEVKEEEARNLNQRQSHFFISISHMQSRKIFMSDFLYAESKRGYTDIYLTGSRLPITISHSLGWLQRKLWDGRCLRISEHHLVNCDNILFIHPYYTVLTLMNETSLTINLHYHASLKNKIMKFMHG